MFVANTNIVTMLLHYICVFCASSAVDKQSRVIKIYKARDSDIWCVLASTFALKIKS